MAVDVLNDVNAPARVVELSARFGVGTNWQTLTGQETMMHLRSSNAWQRDQERQPHAGAPLI
jgi:hypothetical protein